MSYRIIPTCSIATYEHLKAIAPRVARDIQAKENIIYYSEECANMECSALNADAIVSTKSYLLNGVQNFVDACSEYAYIGDATHYRSFNTYLEESAILGEILRGIFKVEKI